MTNLEALRKKLADLDDAYHYHNEQLHRIELETKKLVKEMQDEQSNSSD